MSLQTVLRNLRTIRNLPSYNTKLYFHCSSINNLNVKQKRFQEPGSKLTKSISSTDDMPSNYSLVYRAATDKKYILPVKTGCQITVLLSSCIPVYIMMNPRMAHMAATGGTFYSANIFETWGFYAILMMHCVAILRFVHNTPLRIYYCEEKDDFVFVFSNIFQFNKVTKVSVPSGGLEHNEVENKASPFTAWKYLNIVTLRNFN